MHATPGSEAVLSCSSPAAFTVQCCLLGMLGRGLSPSSVAGSMTAEQMSSPSCEW